ncbi:MAG: aminotransferase class IV [Bryobacteraceae bacterium]|nr:aminotransferase class IV [Bryobacteraceae bacterium]
MIHPHVLISDEILPADHACLRPGQVGLFSGWGIFSTIRVIGGVLFAFDRHWARMRRDADMLRVPFPWTPAELEQKLLQLVEANRAYDAALRVLVMRNRGTVWEGPGVARDYELVAFTAPRTRWGESARLGIVAHARHAASPFAGTKSASWAMNLVWYEEAHARGLDEVILLNEKGEVSECTSANVFAVFGREAATPPIESGCLPGITRELLLEAIRVPGVRIVERALTLDDLERADGLFITSTTRDILPVASVEGLSIRNDWTVARELAQAFADYQEQYVAGALRRAATED